MKLIKLYIVIFSLVFASSCGEDLAKFNIDPNTSPTARPAEVLTAGMVFYSIALDGYFNEENAVLSQYWAGGPGVALLDIERYFIVPGDYNTEWSFSYLQALSDLDFVIKNGNGTRSAVADIYSVLIYQNLVDHYGDIPYSQAIGGADGATIVPAYDNAETIYTDLLTRIDASRAKLSSIDDFGAEDVMYAGDIESWIKFANSLELRLLVRQGTDSDRIRSVVDRGNFIETAEDMAAISFSGGATNNWNPQYARREQGIGMFYTASNTFVSVLEELNDPRLQLLYDVPVNGGDITGLDQGNVQDLIAPSKDDFSFPAAAAYGEANDVILMSNWEVMFLRSEAAMKYGTSDDEKLMFDNAVTAHFDHIGAAGSAEYLANNAVYDAASAEETKLGILAVQKWISMNGLQESEGWIEMRRLDNEGNGVFTNPTSGILNTPTRTELGQNVFPSIRLYPQSELDFNSNTPLGRSLTDKVFWDK